MSDNKEAQKRAALARWINLAEFNLERSIRDLRYWCVAEADKCETELKKYHNILKEMTADKKVIVETTTRIDDTVAYMMWLYTENLCGAQKWLCNPEFTPAQNYAHMDYANKVQKAFEAKQMHAPGFDGQGGGAERGSLTPSN